jgi:hypothetical protein
MWTAQHRQMASICPLFTAYTRKNRFGKVQVIDYKGHDISAGLIMIAKLGAESRYLSIGPYSSRINYLQMLYEISCKPSNFWKVVRKVIPQIK